MTLVDLNASLTFRYEGDVMNVYLQTLGGQPAADDPLLFTVSNQALKLDKGNELYVELEAVLSRWLRRRVDELRGAPPKPQAPALVAEDPFPGAEEVDA